MCFKPKALVGKTPAGTGVAHLLEHVLLSSTELRSKREANRQLDALGGRFNGYTAHEVTTYHIACDPDDWEFAVEWLAEHVVTPGFDPDDVAEYVQDLQDDSYPTPVSPLRTTEMPTFMSTPMPTPLPS